MKYTKYKRKKKEKSTVNLKKYVCVISVDGQIYIATNYG